MNYHAPMFSRLLIVRFGFGLAVIFYGSVVMSRVHEVIVQDNSFSPSTVIIEAGDTVRWINQGSGSHNVFAAGRFRCAQGCEAEGGDGNPSSTNWVAEVTFNTPENVVYQCQPHVKFGMIGTVVVQTPEVAAEVLTTIDEVFVPDDITVVEGQVVRFQNELGVHNIRAVDDSFICSEGCEGDGQSLDTDPTGFPWDIYLRFDQVGEIPYYCAEHDLPGQTGIIRIIADALFVNGFE